MVASSTVTGGEAGEAEGFVDFFRRYTKTWVHGVSTAGLTGFGMLTFVHRWFAVLAIASYVVPPVGLYLAGGGGTADAAETDATDERAPRSRSADRESGSPSRDATDRASVSDGTDARSSSDPGRRPRDDPAGVGGDRSSAGDTSAPGESASVDTSTSDESTSDDKPTPAGDAKSDRDARWTAVDSPTDAALFDVTLAGATAVAVGGEGVVVTGEGDEWTVSLEDGPNAGAETLYGVDSTDDGAVAWVAGDNGALGRLETDSSRHVDHSAPNDLTDNLTGIAVAGTAGEETVLLINGSGEVLRGRYRGGDLAWESPVKPGSGSSLSDVVLADDVGYCCDTNDGVFRTEDGGRTFETIGLEGADGVPTALASTGTDDCLVATDAGAVHRYDGTTWTPERIGEEAITGVARAEDRVAVCDDAGGVSERADPGADWKRFATSAPGPLRGAALGADRGTAVGDEGTVVERY